MLKRQSVELKGMEWGEHRSHSVAMREHIVNRVVEQQIGQGDLHQITQQA